MPIKQEIMNKIALLAFKKLQSAVLLEHFYQQHFDVLEQKDKQRVIHRALFYLSLELMVFDYSELTQDNWDYMSGEKYARAFIMALVKADPVAVLSLTMPQIISLLYPYINDYHIDRKIRTYLRNDLALLCGYKTQEALPWRPTKEWLPGIIFTYYRQENIVQPLGDDGCCGAMAETPAADTACPAIPPSEASHS